MPDCSARDGHFALRHDENTGVLITIGNVSLLVQGQRTPTLSVYVVVDVQTDYSPRLSFLLHTSVIPTSCSPHYSCPLNAYFKPGGISSMV